MEKRDYKHGKFTIATTDTDQFTYDDYLDACLDMDIEPEEEDSASFYNWCEEEAQANWEADLSNIKYCKAYDVPVIITGTLGLWWGHPDIDPVIMDNVYDAIQKCIGDCYVVEVEWNDGEIIVYASHHDGTNVFTINALSKKGLAKQSNDYKPHDIKRLPYLYAI